VVLIAVGDQATGCVQHCTLVSFTNKTDRHDITEILLKMALSTINQPTNFKSKENINTKNMDTHMCVL
jgi:hypothetical protein